MAAGVLVYQGGIVHKPAHAYGGVVLHQRGLAQIPGVFVGAYQGLQHLPALVRKDLHYFTLLEPEPEVIYLLPAQHQGPGGVDHALGPKLIRGGAYLLRGDIGVKWYIPLGYIAVKPELGPGGQPHRQVRAVRGGIVQRSQLQLVHRPAPLGVLLSLLLPGLHNVVFLGDIAEPQEYLPQLVHRVFAGLVQYVLGPLDRWHHGDKPLAVLLPAGLAHDVPHRVHMGEYGVGVLLANVLHELGVHALQPHIAGPIVQIALVHGVLPVLHPAHVLVRAVPRRDLHVGQVQVVHYHVARAKLIALLGEYAGELPALHRRLYQNGLALLDVEPHPCQGIGVFSLHLFQVHFQPLLQVHELLYIL